MGCLLPCDLNQFLRAPPGPELPLVYRQPADPARYACMIVSVLLPGSSSP